MNGIKAYIAIQGLCKFRRRESTNSFTLLLTFYIYHKLYGVCGKINDKFKICQFIQLCLFLKHCTISALNGRTPGNNYASVKIPSRTRIKSRPPKCIEWVLIFKNALHLGKKYAVLFYDCIQEQRWVYFKGQQEQGVICQSLHWLWIPTKWLRLCLYSWFFTSNPAVFETMTPFTIYHHALVHN